MLVRLPLPVVYRTVLEVTCGVRGQHQRNVLTVQEKVWHPHYNSWLMYKVALALLKRGQKLPCYFSHRELIGFQSKEVVDA